VGGVSVLRELRARLPDATLLYVADSKYVPYGTKAPETIRERSSAIVRFFVEQHCQAVVVACNTATTHAVDMLRRDFSDRAIVGMEPAIKPAASATLTGVVGILATGSTLSGARVSNLIERHKAGITVLTQPCPGLVEQVEAGDLSGPDTVDLVRRYTQPLIDRGADAIVLGCTHYTFLRDTITQVVGPSVSLFDGAQAVARQAAHVISPLERQGDHSAAPGRTMFFTTGSPVAVARVLEQMWGEPIPGVQQLLF
jgi:glutamate racemase